MSFAATATIAAAAIGAGSSIYSARRASQTGRDAAALADPFAGDRGTFAQRLVSDWDRLSTLDPMAILNDPAYQFIKEQGLSGINASAAAGGSFNSGNRLRELTRFSSGLASQFADRQFQQRMQIADRLGQYSGATTGNPAAAGQYMGYGSSAATNYLSQGVGNTLALLNRVPWSQLFGPAAEVGGGSNVAQGVRIPSNPGWGG